MKNTNIAKPYKKLKAKKLKGSQPVVINIHNLIGEMNITSDEKNIQKKIASSLGKLILSLKE